MKLFYISILSISIFLSSCNNNRTPVTEKKQEETPKALQTDNNSSGGSFISKKRYAEDLVEELYNELLEKNAMLSELEHNIDKVKEDRKDSLELFKTFDSKNNSYYNAANNHIGSIKDSTLKSRTKQFIENSLARYKIKIAAHNNLIAAIDTKNVNLDDLHVILKITQTLAMMEKYQTNDLPSTKALESISKTYDKIIAKTESLGNK